MRFSGKQSGANTTVLVVAGALGLGIIGAGGVHYRHALERFGTLLSSTPIARGTLACLPLDLDGWKGREQPLDERVIRATDTDDHLSRVYASTRGFPPVLLFIGYGINVRDLTPHRPEVCYVGSGWTPMGADSIELELPGGDRLPCRIFRFRQGDLSPRQRIVLHYYIVDGRCGADVRWFKDATLRGASRAHYAARVQIECDIGEGAGEIESSLDGIRAFAVAGAKPILALLPQVDDSAGGRTP